MGYDEEKSLVPEQNETVSLQEDVGEMIRQMMQPVLNSMAQIMAQNTEALERIAAQQKVQADRMESLEKQIRLQTPVTAAHVKYLNAAMARRAMELLERAQLNEDKKAVKKLAACIRKRVLAHYGAASLRELPRHEYTVAMAMIESWNDLMTVRAVIRDARREEQTT